MARAQGPASAIVVLVTLLLAGLAPLVPGPSIGLPEALDSAEASRGSGVALVEGSSTELVLGPETMDNPPYLDLSSTAPLTSLGLRVEPVDVATRDGFSWTGNNAWEASGAVLEGSASEDGSLTDSGGAQFWDFNTGLQGWTPDTTGFSGVVTTPACALNGSTGGAIRTYAGATTITSPALDLSSVSSMPLHAMVRQGSSSCGEEPDSNEDLILEYVNSAGTWTALNTWAGSGTSTNSYQFYSVNLPAGAFHASFALRFRQTSGSGTCCDFWFVDDVRLAAPLAVEWTSPLFGWGSGAANVAEGRWADLRVEHSIPENATLLWSVLDASGAVLPSHHNRTGSLVDLSSVDPTLHDALRLRFRFEPGLDGAMPRVHAVHLDGRWSDHFWAEPSSTGWGLSNGTQWLAYDPSTVEATVGT
ncbi:MAG: hypothetical protein O3B05_06890, partial [archaeon]|nr:hypothetical protein [archaeon]